MDKRSYELTLVMTGFSFFYFIVSYICTIDIMGCFHWHGTCHMTGIKKQEDVCLLQRIHKERRDIL